MTRVLFTTFEDDGSLRFMTLPPDKIGDHGQRFEIRAQDEDGAEFVLGWGEHPDAWADAVAAHPSWHSRRVIDRDLHDRQLCGCPYCQRQNAIFPRQPR